MPLAVILKGGYDLAGPAHSVAATLQGRPAWLRGAPSPSGDASEAPFAALTAPVREGAAGFRGPLKHPEPGRGRPAACANYGS